MNDERKGSRPALHIGVAGASLGSASAEGWRPGQGQNVEIELARCALPRILCRRRSGVNNNASNARRNTTLVMTTPLYAFDKRKDPRQAFGTDQEQIFQPIHTRATMFGDNGDCYGGNRKRAGNHPIRRLA